MRFASLLSVIGIALGCGACASIERFGQLPFEDPARVDSIALGSTTRPQVRAILGEPNDRSAVNGEETWIYKSYRTLPLAYVPFHNPRSASMQTLVVRVAFNGSGVVKNVDTDKQQW